MDQQVRVRFAPSPTGHLHVGGARTALFNWLFARSKGGKFVLRIEDTDQERSTEESYRAIVDALRWLGLDWDEGPIVGGDYGPYFQSQRRHLYRELAERLVAEGKAYICCCTQGEVAVRRAASGATSEASTYDRRCRDLAAEESSKLLTEGRPHVIRIKTPLEGETAFDDLVHGRVAFQNPNLEDFVLIKSDGFPTYNFAATIDDISMKISHIIRGDDHISNTPRQIVLYQAFGVAPPYFAHVPLIMGADKTRLSKRHGATSVAQFTLDGYLPEAMVNYLALLGWSYDAETSLFEIADLISKFSLEKVSSTPAVFDYQKLAWINGEYMKKRSREAKIALVIPHLQGAGLVGAEVDEAALRYIGDVVDVIGERLKIGRQILEQGAFFFKDQAEYDAAAAEEFLKRHYVGPAFRILEERLAKLENFDVPSIEAAMRGLATEMGLKAGDLFQPVRIALTGSRFSPGLFETMAVLGKARVLARLEAARKAFA
ncbi:MAG: glutamate--tRNA ligase [Candidatus Eisenbacteria bacterium]